MTKAMRGVSEGEEGQAGGDTECMSELSVSWKVLVQGLRPQASK